MSHHMPQCLLNPTHNKVYQLIKTHVGPLSKKSHSIHMGMEGPVDVKHHLHHLPASVVVHMSHCFGHGFGSWNGG
jgi:hypothetical protein